MYTPVVTRGKQKIIDFENNPQARRLQDGGMKEQEGKHRKLKDDRKILLEERRRAMEEKVKMKKNNIESRRQ